MKFKTTILTIGCLILFSCKEVKRHGVIISHNVTSDRYGNPTYNSIVKMDNGEITVFSDVECYVLPINSPITTTSLR
jgi:hypothetical protein